MIWISDADCRDARLGARGAPASRPVPVEAFRLIVDRETRTADDGLAVPLAGNDAAAKEIVAEFMRQIGVEPFDLGPLTGSCVMEPGGRCGAEQWTRWRCASALDGFPVGADTAVQQLRGIITLAMMPLLAPTPRLRQ
jgi:hypothetical protein